MMSLVLFGQREIVSADLNPDTGCFEVVYRIRSRDTYTSPTASYLSNVGGDTVVKLVYGVRDGKITLFKTVAGKHTPATMVPENIEFPE